MWPQTKASKILGIEYPILLGPFGGNLSTVELTAIVSNEGGLGGYGMYTLNPDEMVKIDQQIRSATNKPYNLNLWVSDSDVKANELEDQKFNGAKTLFKPYFDELNIEFPATPPSFQSRYQNQIQVILDLQPPAFSFMFGIPEQEILEQCRRQNIKLIGAATTLDEAIALENAGVDLIIASGFEAGGHRPSFLASAESSVTGTFVLLQLITQKVKTPVIAAGGIADAKGVAGAFTLGASAVQIGTAFLACEESNAPAIHRDLLFSDAAKYTTLTRAFTGRLGRGLINRVSKEIAGKENQLLPFPLQGQMMSSLRKASLEKQRWDMILFWSGQIAPVLKHRKAKELMQSLINDTNSWFQNLPGTIA